jgi:hypothetical protein
MIAHPIHKIRSFRITGPFTLELIFEDSKKRIVDFLPLLKGQMYGPLAHEDFFKTVYLDQEVHTISWPNGADFDPEILYNWDKYKDELITRANKWQG